LGYPFTSNFFSKLSNGIGAIDYEVRPYSSCVADQHCRTAEIICTQHSGCFETGLKILNHGGAYGGLTYTNNREMKTDARGYPVRNKPARIVREHW
jgi:hypothetical protein